MELSPEYYKFAQRLLAFEAGGEDQSLGHCGALFRICEKLRTSLSGLVGVLGFRALLTRALTLAKREVLWLSAIQINSEASLVGLTEIESQLDSEAIQHGGTVLVGHLLGLLIAFVGEELTISLINEVWPSVRALQEK